MGKRFAIKYTVGYETGNFTIEGKDQESVKMQVEESCRVLMDLQNERIPHPRERVTGYSYTMAPL